MADGVLSVTQIQGLLPALDPRQVTEPHIIKGRNFSFNPEGPKSDFGGRLLAVVAHTTEPEHTESFDLDSDIRYFSPGGVYSYVPATKTYSLLLDLVPHWVDIGFYKWTNAFVGNKYYFCHPNLPQKLIQYDVILDTWTIITNVTFWPAGLKAVTQGAGRLIILGDSQYKWSAQDDGSEFDPASGTGAGFQGISLIGGTSITISELNDGFLTYTSTGIILVSLLGTAAATFRHQILTKEVKLIDSFAIINIDGAQHIVLTERGFFVNDNITFNPFRPLFNEFLIIKAFPTLGKRVRLAFCPLRQQLFLSFKTQIGVEFFDRCYVLPRNLEKWSTFDRVHYAITLMDLPEEVINVSACTGFVDLDKLNVIFTDDIYFESYNGATIDQNHLDSFVRIGLFRFTDGLSDSRLGEIINLQIGNSLYPGEAVIEEEDWNEIGGMEDWNILIGSEDWGVDVVGLEKYSVRIVGTLDGTNPFNDGNDQVPVIYAQQLAVYFYSCQVTGLYFFIEISTEDTDEWYQIKTIELSGLLAGLL